MEWLPQYSTKVIIIDIIKQEIIKTLYTEPFFAMHHINSYEENNKIILDLIYYKDSNIINKFYLNNIKKLTNFPGGTIKRLIIDLNKDIINLQDYFTDIKIEMPNINLNYKTNKYRFFYSISNNSIIKLDMVSNKINIWYEKYQYPQEPQYINNGNLEDSGYILSNVLDGNMNKTYLLILNATNMIVINKYYMPLGLPMLCHGLFIKQNLCYIVP